MAEASAQVSFVHRRGKKRPVAVKFWEKVDKNGPPPECRPDLGNCWLWLGSLTEGYGQFGGPPRTTAHRWAWQQDNGPVPPGLELDHLCRVRRCCRPSHLEPVTRRINMLRGETVAAVSAAATTCPQGHPYDEANTMRTPDGHRRCRDCQRARERRNHARRMADPERRARRAEQQRRNYLARRDAPATR